MIGMTEQESYPAQDVPRTPRRRVRASTVAYVLQEFIGAIPPVAALGLAGYYQTEIAHDVLHFAYPWALVPAMAIEGGAAYCAILYDRHLVAGDSTTALRVGMLGYAAGSSALLAWHAHATHKPWEIAVALGLLTLSALFLWGRRGKWRKREVLRERGLLDAQVVRFSFARYLAAPLETPAALRYAVKHSITEPAAAVEAWRTHRTEVRTRKVAANRAKADVKPVKKQDVPPAVDSEQVSPSVPAAPRRTQPRGVRALSSVRTDDDAVLKRLDEAQAKKGTQLTLDEVSHIAGGKRPRAVRLRRLMDDRASRTPAAVDDAPADDSDRELVPA